jgi:hypothetical protein
MDRSWQIIILRTVNIREARLSPKMEFLFGDQPTNPSARPLAVPAAKPEKSLKNVN